MYESTDFAIMKIPPLCRRALAMASRHPAAFPALLWLMLIMEEKAMTASRRFRDENPGSYEPHFAAAYRFHLGDEAAHVQIDWHLLEYFHARRRRLVRTANAALLRWLIGNFFLPPTRSGARILHLLAGEQPELTPFLPGMVRALRDVNRNTDYQEMMYSRQTTPITFSLFDRFPEFSAMKKTLLTYQPEEITIP
jgi:hypothetical protein